MVKANGLCYEVRSRRGWAKETRIRRMRENQVIENHRSIGTFRIVNAGRNLNCEIQNNGCAI